MCRSPERINSYRLMLQLIAFEKNSPKYIGRMETWSSLYQPEFKNQVHLNLWASDGWGPHSSMDLTKPHRAEYDPFKWMLTLTEDRSYSTMWRFHYTLQRSSWQIRTVTGPVLLFSPHNLLHSQIIKKNTSGRRRAEHIQWHQRVTVLNLP